MLLSLVTGKAVSTAKIVSKNTHKHLWTLHVNHRVNFTFHTGIYYSFAFLRGKMSSPSCFEDTFYGQA